VDEFWSLEQLLRLAGWNQVMKPQRTDLPLVIFRGWDELHLIDGNNRVNLWRHNGNKGPHRALVLEPKESRVAPFRRQ